MEFMSALGGDRTLSGRIVLVESVAAVVQRVSI
jgi:hypothetical protein